jgi:hypothetical protein
LFGSCIIQILNTGVQKFKKKNLWRQRDKPLPANVENMVSTNNARKWQMGINWVFKGLNVNKSVSNLLIS